MPTSTPAEKGARTKKKKTELAALEEGKTTGEYSRAARSAMQPHESMDPAGRGSRE